MADVKAIDVMNYPSQCAPGLVCRGFCVRLAEYVRWAKGDGNEFFQADSGEDFLIYSKTPSQTLG